jgi:glycosyltransferase involved in cell wall biosynthesis
MKIALNMLFVGQGLAGGRVYCEGLLRGLAALDSPDVYTVFTRRDISLPAGLDARFQQFRAPIAASSSLWRTFWEYGILPRKVRQGRHEVLHGLGSLSPRASGCPLVLTIHDLIYRHFPHSIPLGHRLFMQRVFPIVARRAERVIVPSECTGREVVRYLGVRPERVRLIHEGPGNSLERVTDEATVQKTLQKFGIRRPYVISVARAYAHKNIAGLLRAMAALHREGPRGVQLVLVGDRYQSGHELDRLTRELQLGETIVFTGFVSAEDLSALYSAAAVFAFPSLAEGCGLPVLEAMACGTPVVASNASAIPEAVGGAGLLADARKPSAFAAQLGRVLGDDSLQEQLREKGLVRVQEFSWEKAAAAVLAVYRELV